MPTNSEFQRVDFGKPSRASLEGEYGQANPSNTAPEPADTSAYPQVYDYGYDPGNRMFSQDKSNEPLDLARETDQSMGNFSDLQKFLNNNLDVAGGRVAHDRKQPWTPPHPEGRTE